MAQMQQTTRDRIKSAAGVAAIHALIGFALIRGLGFQTGEEARETVKMFDVAPEPPPPPIAEPARVEARKQKAKAEKPEGAASPKNLRDTPSPIVAPPPAIVLPVPSPVIAAPVAAEGNGASAGASDVPGPGTGSGGQGTGLGSGDAGDGTGGGGGGGAARPARQIAGRIQSSDYPREALRARQQGTLDARYTVTAKGRVRDCIVVRSSGHALLDNTTCRLITRRFRFRPALNGEGKPVPSVIIEDHMWILGREPEPIDFEPMDIEPDIPD